MCYAKRMQRTTRERFLCNVQIGDDHACWLWRGRIVKGGYGGFSGDGQNMAHRYAYQSMVGPIPAGLFVCHSCDIRNCVNPAHLWVGTNQQNMDDMCRKGRSPHLPGERNPFAVLTDDTARAVIAAASEAVTHSDIAARFGVSRSTVGLLLAGRTWGHLERSVSRPKAELALSKRAKVAKLTPADVAAIPSMYRAGGWSYVSLGAHFGVSRGAINAVLNGHSWRDLTPA